MPKSTPEDDVNDLIEDCDSIIELLKKKKVGGTISDTGNNTWPDIKLDDDDISFLTDILEKNGKIVAKIRIFADKLGNDFPQLAQQIVDAHSRILFTATAMEQGRVHQIDFGKIWKQVDVLKKNLLDFESIYRIQKSYNSVKYDYDKITPESSGGIHWGKLGIIIAIVLFISGSIVTILVSQYYFDLQKHDQQLTNSTDLGKTIAQQTIIETYDKGQPYSLQWTNCGGPIHETTQTGDTKNWMMTFTPMLIDKNNNAALIKFNTNYYFDIYDVFSVYRQNLEPVMISMHQVDPSNREPIILNLTKTLSDAEHLGIYEIRINLTENSFAPYSDKTNNNLVDYVHDKKEYIMTDLTYLNSLDKWVKSDVDNSICKNYLIER
jgi:hypothetical protein